VDPAHDETERCHVGPEPHRALHSPGPGPGTVMCVSWTTLGSSRCRQSNAGRSERIGGSHSKLCSGGGEDVTHSSVYPPHGSSPAGRLCRNACTRSVRKISTPTAMMNPPTVASSFGVVH